MPPVARKVRAPMIRISLPYVYGLADALEPLDSLQAGADQLEVLLKLWQAEDQLNNLLSASVFSMTLRSSRPLAENLLRVIRDLKLKCEQAKDVDQHDAASIAYAFRQYKIALLAEIATFPSYFVTQKSGYDTLSLLDRGECLFPDDLIQKVPEAIFDIREAGKALAFELSTACGFHAFRATESVLRRYYAAVTGNQTPPKVRNIAVYIEAIRRSGAGDARILAALKQMSDLYRNPLVHPEVVLTTDEAVAILGIARSVITAMLSALPVMPPTTTTHSVSSS